MIPADEVENIREVADTFYRQAPYENEGDENDRRAEFIAKEMRDRLDDLLEAA